MVDTTAGSALGPRLRSTLQRPYPPTLQRRGSLL